MRKHLPCKALYLERPTGTKYSVVDQQTWGTEQEEDQEEPPWHSVKTYRVTDQGVGNGGDTGDHKGPWSPAAEDLLDSLSCSLQKALKGLKIDKMPCE